MYRTHLTGTLVLLVCSVCLAHAQADSVAAQPAAPQKPVVVSSNSNQNAVAVPPSDSQWTSLRKAYPKGRGSSSDLAAWLRKESTVNGLESADLHPWHIVITYDQFDEDGDNVNSGTYEEFWAGPRKYRRTYKSDKFNQTEVATDHGLFRSGDQKWGRQVERQVRNEILAPFYYGETLQGFRARVMDRSFGSHKLECVLLERDEVVVSDPTQYCFESGSSILRFARGTGWFQTAYNNIVSFQARNIALDVQVTTAGKPYLKLHVGVLEAMRNVDESLFAPAPDAVNLLGKRVSGVDVDPAYWGFPTLPSSLRGQRVSIQLEVVVGKDGKVISARAIDGPAEALKPAEEAVRKWRYLPYMILGEPVEVETTVGFEFINSLKFIKKYPSN